MVAVLHTHFPKHFLEWKWLYFLFKFHVEFTLVQIMAWRRTGFSFAIHYLNWWWFSSLTFKCISRPHESMSCLNFTVTSQWALWRLKSLAHDCLLNCLFRCISKKASKLCVTGLCVGNSPVTGEFPTQRASNAENGTSSWICRLIVADGWLLSISESFLPGLFCPQYKRRMVVVSHCWQTQLLTGRTQVSYW